MTAFNATAVVCDAAFDTRREITLTCVRQKKKKSKNEVETCTSVQIRSLQDVDRIARNSVINADGYVM